MEIKENRSFKDLEVWQVSTELRREFEGFAKSLPKNELYRLADQIIRASRSVTNNIAEGYGRFHLQENIQFCRQSRGSVYELIDHLIIANDNSYISQEVFIQYESLCIRVIKLINGYIRYLGNQKLKAQTN
ncbi:MAG: four helix bundle protein [Bacteroidia bacterium]|nr:four helix bundle protein [Bacteroidia bacterium]